MSKAGGSWGPEHEPSHGWNQDPRGHGPTQPGSGQYHGFGVYEDSGRYEGFGVFQDSGRYENSGNDSAAQRTTPTPMPHDRTPRRRRGFVLTALALGAVVLTAGVLTVIWVAQPSEAPQATPPAVSTDSTTTQAETPSVAGWQAVPVPRRGAVYDAPSSWTKERPDNVIAFGPPDNTVTMTGVTVYKKGFCAEKPNSYRAIAGATAREGSDDSAVATTTLEALTKAAFPTGAVERDPPKQVELDQGSAQGVRVTATVTNPEPGPCDAPQSVVSVLARNNDGQRSVVHLAIAEQGVPEAFPPNALTTMVQSFRPGS